MIQFYINYTHIYCWIKRIMIFMKTIKFILITIGVVFFTLIFQSCLDNDSVTWIYTGSDGLVTVKLTDENSFYLQLDDSTTLLPVNMTTPPFGKKQMRALVNFDVVDKPSGKYTKAVNVNWIDSILTKSIAPDLGINNDSVYGKDPVDILKSWMTVSEDGYLTLCFSTIYGNSGKGHYVNLLMNSNPSNPYEVEFRHNAYGDVSGLERDGIVAFNLDSLPDTNGKTVKLKLKWKSFTGDKSTEFDYCTRKSDSNKSNILQR